MLSCRGFNIGLLGIVVLCRCLWMVVCIHKILHAPLTAYIGWCAVAASLEVDSDSILAIESCQLVWESVSKTVVVCTCT